jgi:hypothetical protein
LSFWVLNKNISSKEKEIVFDNGYKINDKGLIINNKGEIVEDSNFESNEKFKTSSTEKPEDISEVANDGSRINIMYDAVGNKTETRYFNNSRLKYLVLRTTVNGQREIFVFGQNGQTKSLPENMLDEVLTASADEIANAAGIYQAFKRVVTPPVASQNNQTVSPLPNYNLPIQNQPVEASALPENQSSGLISKPDEISTSTPEIELKKNVENTETGKKPK